MLMTKEKGPVIIDEQVNAWFNTVPDIITSWLPQDFNWTSADVLDFGCGDGVTALSFACRHRCRKVVGVDVLANFEKCLRFAAPATGISDFSPNLMFKQIESGEIGDHCQYDLIYSWSSVEHVDQRLLVDIFRKLACALKPGGFLFMQVDPLFLLIRRISLIS